MHMLQFIDRMRPNRIVYIGLYQQHAMTLMMIITIYGAVIQLWWCMGVVNNYTCYRQLYRLVPVLFTPVQLDTFKNFLGIFDVLHVHATAYRVMCGCH